MKRLPIMALCLLWFILGVGAMHYAHERGQVVVKLAFAQERVERELLLSKAYAVLTVRRPGEQIGQGAMDRETIAQLEKALNIPDNQRWGR